MPYLKILAVLAALLHLASAGPVPSPRLTIAPTTCTSTDPPVYHTPSPTVKTKTTTAPIERLERRDNTYDFGITDDRANTVIYATTKTGKPASKSWPDAYAWPFPWSEIKAITNEIYLTRVKIDPILLTLSKLFLL